MQMYAFVDSCVVDRVSWNFGVFIMNWQLLYGLL